MKYLKCKKNNNFSWNIIDDNNNFLGLSGVEPTGVYLIKNKSFEDAVDYVNDKLNAEKEIEFEKCMDENEIKIDFSDNSTLTEKIFYVKNKYFVVKLSNNNILLFEGAPDEIVCGSSYKEMYGEICNITFKDKLYNI